MGIFSRWTRNVEPPRHQTQDTVVTVAFRDLGVREPLKNFSVTHGYVYLWPFHESPRVGQWAVADGADGPTSVIVGALGGPPTASGMQLRPLLRLIPETDVEAARNARDASAAAWLDLARRAVGLPPTRPEVGKTPAGFDPLPPAQPVAGPGAAENGAIWWRAFKLAEQLDRDQEETNAFKTAAQGWFRERDRMAKAEQVDRIEAAVESTGLEAAIDSVRSRTRSQIEDMLLAGLPLWDWLRHAQDLDREGRQEDALRLLEALITAAEQEAKLSGREPAPAYTERAAIIHRKRRDYSAEIDVIERWMDACPPERRGPGATQAKLITRLSRARELAGRA